MAVDSNRVVAMTVDELREKCAAAFAKGRLEGVKAGLERAVARLSEQRNTWESLLESYNASGQGDHARVARHEIYSLRGAEAMIAAIDPATVKPEQP